MVDFQAGYLLARRYRLMEQVGQGSMGKVYLAEDTVLGGVYVAVKVLLRTLLNDKMQERFIQEAKTCAQLGQKSIHVVRVTDFGFEDDIPFYVMEYLKGQNLSDLLGNEPIPVPRFLNLSRQICLGLYAAHEGIFVDGVTVPIIHRDIKPSNIAVISDKSLGEVAKVLDFGIAKRLQTDSDQTNCFMGTLAYSSPEQMEGRELDSRSDIYSLGVMMYQMLTTKMPLRAETHTFGGWYKAHHAQVPRSIAASTPNLKVPKLLESLIMSCLEKQRENRPQSVTEILEALEPLEQRYGSNLKVSQRIGAALTRVPVTARPEVTPKLSEDQLCRLTSWPQEKPIAEIVFPKVIHTSQNPLMALWIMMPQEEVQKRFISFRYNTFLCTLSPHPMLLWLTVLYSRQHGPRWLPCYLDLKNKQNKQMAWLLGKNARYRLLFFAQENPRKCLHTASCNVAAPQGTRLQEWVLAADSTISVASPLQSKELLQAELVKLKPQIISKLEALTSQPPT